MKIKELKKAILDNYQNSKSRKLDNYYSDEIRKGLDELLNYADDTEIDVKEIENNLSEIEISELADSMVDPYTADLLKWYSDNLHRCYYADDFMSEMGGKNFIEILVGGQYMYYSELLNYVFELIKDELEKE